MPFMIAPLRQASPDIVEHDLTGYLCDRCLIATVSRVGGDIARGAAIPRPYDLACDAHQCPHVVWDDGVTLSDVNQSPAETMQQPSSLAQDVSDKR